MKAPGRVLAVDYGSKRVGLAISDETATLARPLKVIEDEGEDTCVKVAGVAVQEDVHTVVVGRPQTLRGGASASTQAAEQFAERLRGYLPSGVEVVLWDERLTTKQALAAMRETGTSERRGRGRVDMVSAALLLQSYLDGQRGSTGSPPRAGSRGTGQGAEE